MEKPITFKNNNNQILFGILHIPNDEPKLKMNVGINMLNPGLKTRVAPNRLYIKLARKFCAAGLYVFRFDAAGIGDSEGEIEEGSVFDIWGSIQSGRFVQDTSSANDFFINYCKLDKLVLMGACGGAISALLTSEYDDRVDNLILIDVPITVYSQNVSFINKQRIFTSEHYRNNLLKSYFKKFWSPTAWKNLLSGKSDLYSLLALISSMFDKSTSLDDTIPIDNILEEFPNFNLKFFEAFQKFIKKGKKILFIMAENDSDTKLFEIIFNRICSVFEDQYKPFYEIFIIKNTNHIYSFIESQQELIDISYNFITKIIRN